MGTLTIRNLDDDVIARLKEQAKANYRSLEAELRKPPGQRRLRVPERDAEQRAYKVEGEF